MSPLESNEAFQAYAVCAAVLVLKMIASALYTGYVRSRVKGYVNPEDAQFGGPGVAAAPQEHPDVARALRIQRNDLENIPAFWVIGLLYVLSGGSAFGAAVYGWIFTLARIAHTVAYARGMQPARALLFGVGALVNVGLAVNVIWKSL